MYPPQQPPPGYPPGYPGYPPAYGQPGYPYMQQMPYRPQRSGAPRAIGVLAIVFSLLGAGASAVWTYGPLTDIHSWNLEDRMHGVVVWLYVWMALSLVLFMLHFIGGILAVQYKRAGLRLLTFYAIGAIVLAIADVAVLYALLPEGNKHDIRFSVGTMHIVFSVMALPWPIVALALANGARAKEACGATTQQAADVF